LPEPEAGLLGAAVKDSLVTEEMRRIDGGLPLRGPALRPATHCFGGGPPPPTPPPPPLLPPPPPPRRAGGRAPPPPPAPAPTRRTLGLHAEDGALPLRPAQPPGRARPAHRGVLHRPGRHPELGPRPVRLRRGRHLHRAPDDQLPPGRLPARGPGALRRRAHVPQ